MSSKSSTLRHGTIDGTLAMLMSVIVQFGSVSLYALMDLSSETRTSKNEKLLMRTQSSAAMDPISGSSNRFTILSAARSNTPIRLNESMNRILDLCNVKMWLTECVDSWYIWMGTLARNGL
ncbi:hypothetical protein OGAPHI_006170 [Ogataea philodendri]|uniref:Uncharacterized protein n=1 Tax=Ogataea philodendri TaxID=1378263 RepID=A0A9P8NYV1_9ASCO|nr:uncharacterized protein OGAPHI_006170 [Ogataea philodendri]KAH3661989.1 hypothetical protein OGAPHI_006170 [Ogataea philodendri]